jgi:hypothetical protein
VNVLALGVGLWLGLSLVKFGNPIILDYLVRDKAIIDRYFSTALNQNPDISSPDSGTSSWVDQITAPWPFSWGIWIVVLLAVASLKVGRFRCAIPRWLFIALFIWFFWQFVASVDTVDWRLSRVTLLHFGACVVGFLVGFYALSQCKHTAFFWGGICAGLMVVFWVTFQQHYGGLEALRKMVFENSGWVNLPPEYLKRISSGRVFSTLIYPNALAGVILLLLPPCLAFLWQTTIGVHRILRGVLIGLFAYSGVACLVWSKSKAGWLIALAIGLVALLRTPLGRATKWILISLVIGVGLAGFTYRFIGYFERGATSASARIDYWKAACRTAADHPLKGTGPGTFAVSYRLVKSPESEMARLTHNDYLQQACDSGLVGFGSYFAFFWGGIVVLYRKSKEMNWQFFSIWLGVLGWCLQGFVEFGLYVPALSWPAFVLFGWLFGLLYCRNIDIVHNQV